MGEEAMFTHHYEQDTEEEPSDIETLQTRLYASRN